MSFFTSVNTADYLLANAQDNRVVFFFQNKEHTYGELRDRAARLAGELTRLNLPAGSRIGILGQNSLFWAAAYLAISKLGFVSVPFSTRLTLQEVRFYAKWVDCQAIFIDQQLQDKYKAAFSNEIAIFNNELLHQRGISAWPDSPTNFDSQQDAVLMFTSGTTSQPRAVRITHQNIFANTESIIEYLALNESERILAILPFYYCFGTSLLHTHLRVGGSLAICNTFAFPETAIELMENTNCTGFAGVPSTFQLLLRHSTFPHREIPSLRKIQQAGGRLHKSLIEELATVKPEAKLYVMYGQTEATARLSYLPPAVLSQKSGSIGKGIPKVKLSVLKEDGTPVRPGERGEIVARGKNISPGYFQDPVSSAEKFIDGALYTGDIATVDEDGYIYIIDRKADFIKSWGYRVSSQEVETCILMLSDVTSVAVVGVENLSAGESIHAFVTLRSKSNLDQEIILDHCRQKLAKYMVPETIHIVNSLPLNANGKVIKSTLRKLATEQELKGEL